MTAKATYSACVSRSIQRQTSLDRHVHGGNVGSLEHDLRHARTVGRIHLSPLEVHSWKVLWEDRVIPSNPHRKKCRCGGATTSNAVDGANEVNTLVMRSPIPCKVVKPRNAGVQVIADVNVALHDAQGRRVVEQAGKKG